MDQDQALLTLAELADKLRVKKSWVYDKTRKTGPGAIPRIMCGKYCRFFLKDVMAWLEKQNAN